MLKPLSRTLSAVAIACLAGCSGIAPNLPGISLGATVHGQVNGVSGSNLRVGLLGSKEAGQTPQELVSAPVTGGAYSLDLPGSPRLDLMSSDSESIPFALEVYQDNNGDGQYDEGDTITQASAANGTFRFFTEDGPPGSYKAGWNLYQNGSYTQTFDTAVNLTA
ncbi:MAG TPA: hypothetical protein V6D47_09650 [Oscillatoriaceae cyanobacterium]